MYNDASNVVSHIAGRFLITLASPVRPCDTFRKRTRVQRSLHTGSCTYGAYDAPCMHTRTYTHARACEPTRVRFPCCAAVWVEGTHGRRKQRIMVITVIKRQPLRTQAGFHVENSLFYIRMRRHDIPANCRPTKSKTRESDRRTPSRQVRRLFGFCVGE